MAGEISRYLPDPLRFASSRMGSDGHRQSTVNRPATRGDLEKFGISFKIEARKKICPQAYT
jgi:hypothetical protein